MFDTHLCYLKSYAEPIAYFGSGAEATIPVLKYSELCNCVYCWVYHKMKFCDKCDKLFCSSHIDNHLCFTIEEG